MFQSCRPLLIAGLLIAAPGGAQLLGGLPLGNVCICPAVNLELAEELVFAAEDFHVLRAAQSLLQVLEAQPFVVETRFAPAR